MLYQELREKHPKLTYRSFSVTQDRGYIQCKFEIVLEPDFVFYPEIAFEYTQPIDPAELSVFAFHLGMIELLSYWKAACPPVVSIEAGKLNADQLAWWHDLFLHGLGEFFFKNEIDFTAPGFLTLDCKLSAPEFSSRKCSPKRAALVLTAGGKDSAVSLELLSNLSVPKTALALNPTRASLDAPRLAGYTHPVIVRRKIDPLLLKLNQAGYLNGHTPFSAYLAFCGMFAGALYGFSDIIVSNERSSSEPNTFFNGYPINHQYSKSVRFEGLFREYAAAWLSPDLNYFSFLRPIYDLQVAALFSRFPRHFTSFRSCNVFQQSDAWCGKCSKCAFVYISLFPFVDKKVLLDIFNVDLFSVEAIQQHIRGLVGLAEVKPFECVGTHDESRFAVQLCVLKLTKLQLPVPRFLQSLQAELVAKELTSQHTQESFTLLSDEHFLPPAYFKVLEQAVQRELSSDASDLL